MNKRKLIEQIKKAKVRAENRRIKSMNRIWCFFHRPAWSEEWIKREREVE